MSSQPWPELTAGSSSEPGLPYTSVSHWSTSRLWISSWGSEGSGIQQGQLEMVAAGFLGSSVPFTETSASQPTPGFTSALWPPPHRVGGTAQETLGHWTSTAPFTGVPGGNDDPTQHGGVTSTAVAAFQRSVTWAVIDHPGDLTATLSCAHSQALGKRATTSHQRAFCKMLIPQQVRKYGFIEGSSKYLRNFRKLAHSLVLLLLPPEQVICSFCQQKDLKPHAQLVVKISAEWRHHCFPMQTISAQLSCSMRCPSSPLL